MIGSQVIAQIPDIEASGSVEEECEELRPDRLFAKSFGRSMMVGYCSKYMPDFVLMGLPRFDFLDELENDLKDSVQYHVDGPVSQSSCIVADTNTWQCNLVDYTSKPPLLDSSFEENFVQKKGVTIQRILPSDFVRQTLTQIQSLARLGIPAKSCAGYFEDMLQELFLKSCVVAEFLESQEMDRAIDHKALGAIVSLKESDMPLLLSIAKTHSLKFTRDLNRRI
ncbi:Folliculin-interacting protein 1 [Basidiobolus ranarum]|uniref:Folliculin-interacting protein 1 n=1 Tax=Basidiobolus ranarum TaxID=34480 RepID=A0ABR2VNF5_9FUNG